MTVNVKDFGAVGDGKTLNTKAIQAAIDSLSEKGGRVLIEDGVYVTGTIIYKSNVEIHIASDAVLLGSPDCADYPEKETHHVNSPLLPRWRNACLIYAEECENISLTGMGTIDCNGHTFVIPASEKAWAWRYHRDVSRPTPPRCVFFTGCKNVKIEDITMTNQPAGWSYWIHDCDYVTVDKIKIDAEVEYPNNDGIHVNSSRNVTISNSSITCGDDCIVVRANNVSLAENKVCERVVVTNCNLTSYSGAIRIGWINDGTIKNCVFSNLVITDSHGGISIMLPHRVRQSGNVRIFDPSNPISTDVGREETLIENILFENIAMDNIYHRPIVIYVDENLNVRCNAIKNIRFSSLHSTSLKYPVFSGREATPLGDIYFYNCSFSRKDEIDGEKSENFDMIQKYADKLHFVNTEFN